MAILLTTKSRGRFFLRGAGIPELIPVRGQEDFCELVDFLNVLIRVRISEVESLTPMEDNDVKALYMQMKAASSPLVH